MTGRLGFDTWQKKRFFPVALVSRPALGTTRPPIQLVRRVLSPGVKRGRSVMLTTHPYFNQRSRMSRSYTSSPTSASMTFSETALLLLTSQSNLIDGLNGFSNKGIEMRVTCAQFRVHTFNFTLVDTGVHIN
jgi:hypothetical protein